MYVVKILKVLDRTFDESGRPIGSHWRQRGYLSFLSNRKTVGNVARAAEYPDRNDAMDEVRRIKSTPGHPFYGPTWDAVPISLD